MHRDLNTHPRANLHNLANGLGVRALPFFVTKILMPEAAAHLHKKVKLLNNREVSQIFGVSLRTVHRIIKSGCLPYVRIRGQIRFRPQDVDEYIDARLVSGEEEPT